MSNNKDLTFEESLKQLENIVEQLESGEIDLEKSVKLYEEGMLLKNFNVEKMWGITQDMEDNFKVKVRYFCAENVDEAYELINYSFTPEVGGQTVNEIGYNSAVIGASDHYSDATKAISQAVYPGDTASKLNPWPPEPPWYADARAEYANKFETA